MQEINLQGSKVLVTGSARGLGESFARALVTAGAQVVISDVLHERGQALAIELGAQAHYVPLDLLDPESIQQGVQAAVKAMGGMTGLINNAAITNSGGKMMEDLALETWGRVMDVNVRGTWLVTKASRPFLASSGRGRVVNLASDTAAGLHSQQRCRDCHDPIASARNGLRQHHGQCNRTWAHLGRGHRVCAARPPRPLSQWARH
jgi:NAD(P)-dependent dehydrogenase (short-subunit alcohol dehydrogenase family)